MSIIYIILIQIFIFAGFIIFLKLLFSRNLDSAVGRLNSLHEENLVKEVELQDELKRAKEERDAEVQKGREESLAIIDEAKKESIQIKLKMQEESRLQCNKIIEQGRFDLDKTKEKYRKEAQLQSLDLAVELIKQVVTEQNKNNLQIEFVNDILLELEKLEKEKFSVAAKEVKIVSCFPLLDSQKQKLLNILSDKLGFKPSLVESVDPTIISGFILELEGLVIDGTLKNRLRQVLSLMKPALGE